VADARPLWSWLTRVCRGAALPVLVERDDAGETVLAAASLHTRALETWHRWRAQGARAGDVVEDPTPHGIEAVVRLLACLAGGLVWRPLRAGSSAEASDSAWRTGPAATLTPTGARPPPRASGVLLSSSGTEGAPRPVLLTQAALCFQLEAHQQRLAPAPDDVRVLTLPWTHAFGLVLDLLLGLVSGQTLEVAPLTGPWSPRSLAQRLAERDATWWCTVPRLLELVVGSAKGLPAPRRILIGGAPVGDALAARTQDWLGTAGRLHVGYGLTEAGPGVAIDGALLPGVLGRVADGRLFIQTPSWCGPGAVDGWNDTGDLASLEASGRLRIVGRASRRVKGPDALWVCLDALEDEVAARPGVRAAAINATGTGWDVTALVEDIGTLAGPLTALLERRLGGLVRLRCHEATPTTLATLAAAPGKSLSAALRQLSPGPSSAPPSAR
jgi:acyl-coenzyme A synthetase/AMP-(fatty) acid ligase